MLIQSTLGGAPAPTLPASNGGLPVIAPTPVSLATEAQTTPQPPSRTASQFAHEVARINAALQQAQRNVELNIRMDEATGQRVVTLKDKETGETLLQYPSDAVLAIARSIDEFQQAQLLNRQA